MKEASRIRDERQFPCTGIRGRSWLTKKRSTWKGPADICAAGQAAPSPSSSIEDGAVAETYRTWRRRIRPSPRHRAWKNESSSHGDVLNVPSFPADYEAKFRRVIQGFGVPDVGALNRAAPTSSTSDALLVLQ